MIQDHPNYGKLDLRGAFEYPAPLFLQEEVMEFEIKDLEIIDGDNRSHQRSFDSSQNTMPPSLPNSIILNELHKENEELQNKLKLNYRRLILFETENNKLIEEKNKLFFETQNYFQKNQILMEKNTELEKQHALDEKGQKLLVEKISSLEKINTTQMSEIRRFGKFHSKIQDVVKPFILQLKKQVAELKAELSQTQRINTGLTSTYKEFCKKIELELNQKSSEIASLYAEKNGLVRTYEEQIHAFSKEILELQARNEDGLKEISRLKKSVEFKNYFENEVIRFKRTHEEDQTRLNELIQKKSAAEARILTLEQSLQESRAEMTTAQNRVSDLEMNLEVTRTQFSKKIDELTVTNERLLRLEKLNNQLSCEMNEINSRQS